jgi:hypothetical protein
VKNCERSAAARLVITRGPRAKPRARRSGSLSSTAVGDVGRRADQEPVAELQPQPVQQRLFHHRPVGAVDRAQRGSQVGRALQLHPAHERIAVVHTAHGYQPAQARGRLRHGVDAGDVADRTLRREGGALFGRETPLLDGERHVAAHDVPRLTGQPLPERLGGGAGGGDGRDAERKAGEEDAEAGYP